MRLDKWVFCESVRQEASGQVTLVGVFPSDMIGFQESLSTPMAMPSLALLAVLDQMNGIDKMRVQCEVKFGLNVIQLTPAIEFDRLDRAARHHTIHLTFANFVVTRFGEYTFKLILEVNGDATSFTRRLRIERASVVAPSPTSTRH